MDQDAVIEAKAHVAAVDIKTVTEVVMATVESIKHNETTPTTMRTKVKPRLGANTQKVGPRPITTQ